MSGLAKYLAEKGRIVAGSDLSESIFVRELREMGVRVTVGNVTESIAEFEVIIYTDAVPENNIQLCEAKKLNKYVVSRGQFLYEMSKDFKNVIAVSGCHGKTTCTSMIAHIFAAAGKKFCAHIGGRDLRFKNYYFCGHDYLITEACEYKKNFLLLKPDTAVILNSRPDHLECYSGEENLLECYLSFAGTSDVSISLYGDIRCGGLTFGFDRKADYSARNIAEAGASYSFTAYEGDNELGRVALSVYGKHNILNALAAIAVSRSSQIPFRYIREGLIEFKGVERRFEFLGEVNGVQCFADYAHHPDEIRAAMRTAQKIANGRIFVVFQPHTYSRTKNLFKSFVRVLSHVNNLLIYRTFAAREYYDDAGSALTLSQKIKKSRYGNDVQDILNFILRARRGDLILFLGAGDIYEIALEIIKSLSPHL